MKISAVLILLFFIWGCATTETIEEPEPMPELIEVSSLPTVTGSMEQLKEVRLQVAFYVLRDGSVGDVRIIRSAGEPAWDLRAAEVMRSWRFSELDEDIEGRWVPRIISLVNQADVYMTLAELTASTKEEADSLYARLREGADFEELITQTENGTPVIQGRYLGEVTLDRYPQKVRDGLLNLQVNSYTPPIKLGNRYVIYKRYNHETPATAQDSTEVNTAVVRQ